MYAHVDQSGLLRSATQNRKRQQSGPAWLYRVYADDDPIYIGQTINLFARLRQHQRLSWWSVTATKVRAVVAPDPATAFRWETAAILDEVPRWNVSIPHTANDIVFADFVERWLINERNMQTWYGNHFKYGPSGMGGPNAYERLFARYRVRHGREFDRSLLTSHYEATAA